MIIRKAELKDAALLSETRKLQLIDEGIAPDCDIDAELDVFFKKWLVSKDFLQLIAEEDGKLLSTAAVIYYDLPPSYTNKIGVRGYITNVYTAPEHRRKGLSKMLLTELLNNAKSRGIKKLWLGASKDGRPLYEKLGFIQQESYMELTLEDKPEV
ncbi:MAG: GNAT family N-acetyltransferase [Oscillospiraceae bacterium]|nr:GNAT family N-acetyltransferase [Oscillospiraceae bacterium]